MRFVGDVETGGLHGVRTAVCDLGERSVGLRDPGTLERKRTAQVFLRAPRLRLRSRDGGAGVPKGRNRRGFRQVRLPELRGLGGARVGHHVSVGHVAGDGRRGVDHRARVSGLCDCSVIPRPSGGEVARALQCCGEHRLFDDGHAGGHVLIVRRRALTVGPRVHVGVGRVTLFRYGRGYGWVLGGAGPVLGELRMVGLCGVARAHRGGHHGGVDRYGARADALDDLGQVGGDDDGVSSASASGAGDREVRVVDKGAGEHADHERVVGGRVARHSPRGPPRLTHRHVVGGGGSVIEIGDGVGCQCKRGRAVGHRGGDGRVGHAPRAQ